MSDLREFHLTDETATSNTARIVGGLVIVLAIGAIGAYSYEAGMWKAPPKQIVASNELPSPTPPNPMQSVAPQPSAIAPPPAQMENAPAQVSSQAATTPSVKTARIHTPAHKPSQSSVIPPSDNVPNQVSPETTPLVQGTPEQPATPDTSMTPPANTPSQSTTVQPALQPQQ